MEPLINKGTTPLHFWVKDGNVVEASVEGATEVIVQPNQTLPATLPLSREKLTFLQRTGHLDKNINIDDYLTGAGGERRAS